MDLFSKSVQRTIARGLLVVPTDRSDVIWTPSVSARLTAAKQQPGKFVALRYPDMIVGTYRTLAGLREKLREQYPGLWIGTDIHHIVENQHLQFIGRRGFIGENSYAYDEPCVLLPQDNHRLLMDSLIGGAVTLQREQRAEDADYGIDYIRQYNAFRSEHPVPHNASRPNRTEKAFHRATWVAGEPNGTRKQFGELISDIYHFAYQNSQEQPLQQIASDLIKALTE